MSYISPIKLNTLQELEEGWTDKVAKYMVGEVDNLILESCMKVSCDVDKDELLKALQYDRGQYEKGYADGKRDAVVRCKDCKCISFGEDGTWWCEELEREIIDPFWYCAYGERREG